MTPHCRLKVKKTMIISEKMVEEMKSVRDSMTKGFTETERQRNVTESKIVALESQVEETRKSGKV